MPVFSSWASNRAPETNNALRCLDANEALGRASHSALHSAIALDVNATWNASGFDLKDLHTLSNHAQLPDDFCTPTQSVDYVEETYDWVRQNFDYKNKVHLLALHVGIVISQCLPAIFPPSDASKSITSETAASYSSTEATLCSLGWVQRTKAKGVSAAHIFVSMLATAIIALQDESSPLQQYYKREKKLGEGWTVKHRKFHLLSPLLFCLFTFTSLLEAKGVTGLLLVRLGIAEGKGRIMGGPCQYGRDWRIKSKSRLEALYDTLMKLHNVKPYEPADALQSLLGPTKGLDVAEKASLTCRTARKRKHTDKS